MNRRNFFQFSGALLLGSAVKSETLSPIDMQAAIERAKVEWIEEQKKLEQEAAACFQSFWEAESASAAEERHAQMAVMREQEDKARAAAIARESERKLIEMIRRMKSG